MYEYELRISETPIFEVLTYYLYYIHSACLPIYIKVSPILYEQIFPSVLLLASKIITLFSYLRRLSAAISPTIAPPIIIAS